MATTYINNVSENTFVVFYGRQPGIYEEWDDCAAQLVGFSCAKYQKFRTYVEAEYAWFKHLNHEAIKNMRDCNRRRLCSGTSSDNEESMEGDYPDAFAVNTQLPQFLIHEEVQPLLFKMCKDYGIPRPTLRLHETKLFREVEYKRYRATVQYSGFHTSIVVVGRFGKDDYDAIEDVAARLLRRLLDSYDRNIRDLNYYQVEVLEEQLHRESERNSELELQNRLLRQQLESLSMELGSL